MIIIVKDVFVKENKIKLNNLIVVSILCVKFDSIDGVLLSLDKFDGKSDGKIKDSKMRRKFLEFIVDMIV